MYVSFFFQTTNAAELVIHIPGNLGQDGVVYRLDYYPPFGYPAPNTTIASKDIRDVIKFSQALPGTKYDFWLYYSNATHNTLTWTANFTTGKKTIPLIRSRWKGALGFYCGDRAVVDRYSAYANPRIPFKWVFFCCCWFECHANRPVLLCKLGCFPKWCLF